MIPLGYNSYLMIYLVIQNLLPN